MTKFEPQEKKLLMRDYSYLDYAAIASLLSSWRNEYKDLVDVWDAQSLYGIPSPGSCGHSGECKQFILRITNKKSLPDKARPQVFFSGELHGNERVGPTAVMEFARTLLEQYGQHPWLTRLVDTRDIFIMPTPNALGYYQNKREENHVDPNRDFPVDGQTNCMVSTAARALNELFREHMFQLSLTYHGGMQAIAFEWGTYGRHHKQVSPDDVAQLALGSSMSAFAGSFNSEGLYPHDRLNDLVYPVSGGMEDWAYSSSWETPKPCKPKTFGGYAEKQTVYSTSQLRAFNILIETSKDKTPSEKSLGTDEQVLKSHQAKGDGHIPRNMRLAIFITEVVQPYIQWYNYTTSVFTWEVGGALYVDSTYLEYLFINETGGSSGGTTASMKGRTRWAGGGLHEVNSTECDACLAGEDISFVTSGGIDDREQWPYIPAFSATLPPPPSWVTHVAVKACAVVDQAFARKPTYTVYPDIPPQSHFVNARTNSSWNQNVGDQHVKTQIEWCSDFVKISLEDPDYVWFYKTYDPAAPSIDDSKSMNKNMGFSYSMIVFTVLILFAVVKIYRRGGFFLAPTYAELGDIELQSEDVELQTE